jgi:hypothetical protein
MIRPSIVRRYGIKPIMISPRKPKAIKAKKPITNPSRDKPSMILILPKI